MKEPSLLASCWTSAGNAYPIAGKNLSPFLLQERIEESAIAGFNGFGLLDADLHVFLAKSNYKTLARILDDNGIIFRECEFLGNWWREPQDPRNSFFERQFLFEAATTLSARVIKIAPDISGGELELGLMSEKLHKLSEEASQYGTSVALEFMAFSNVPTLSLALELVSRADHPNCGLILDAWHLDRSHTPLSEIAALPISVIKAVELDDGYTEEIGDPYDDTIYRRELCGEGEFRLKELIITLIDLGWDGPWGVELISEKHRHTPLDQLLPRVFTSTMNQFPRYESSQA
jgi:sugar phosphate isomerase/epimerase